MPSPRALGRLEPDAVVADREHHVLPRVARSAISTVGRVGVLADVGQRLLGDRGTARLRRAAAAVDAVAGADVDAHARLGGERAAERRQRLGQRPARPAARRAGRAPSGAPPPGSRGWWPGRAPAARGRAPGCSPGGAARPRCPARWRSGPGPACRGSRARGGCAPRPGRAGCSSSASRARSTAIPTW